MVRTNCQLFVCLFALAAMLSTPALAQQEAGDTEIGFSALASFQHTSEVNGNATMIASFGKYFTKNQYFGFSAGPTITFSKSRPSGIPDIPDFGGTQATGQANLAYRHLFGSGNNKVWPFVGLTAGGFFSKDFSSGQAGPEFGLKYYARQNVALEFSYQVSYQFKDPFGGFQAEKPSVLDRSRSLLLFGFKYLF